ncbi:PIN domain-containing protein [Sphingomonas bacterium]|uniref:PIN domain-containing protein n=1 Tax=Sphingomonas bacterium TaxID=1895847 RepID=UPI002610320B|nr:PIN domain-containing protein [Sphingomonas bacterium]MDB5679325.1 VapC toxin family domain ribonuclease [Sphingomonas bacterium]
MHLLDTPIVAALRNARAGQADPGITAWASGIARESLFISVITLHELEAQAGQVARKDRSGGAQWRAWLDDHVMRAFDGRVLSVDAAVVRRAAQLGYVDQRDGLLAATALEHGFTLVTLRPRAFKAARVKLFDPTGFVPETAVDDWRQAARAAPVWVKNLFVRS